MRYRKRVYHKPL